MSVTPITRSLEENLSFLGAAFAEQLEQFVETRCQNAALFQLGVLHGAYAVLQKARDAIIGRPPLDPVGCVDHYRMLANAYRSVVCPAGSREQMNYWLLLAEGFVGGLPQATGFSGSDIDLLRNLAKMFRLISKEGEVGSYDRHASDDDDE